MGIKESPDGSYHDIMQVCTNGHLITANYYKSPEFRKNYCTQCGAETLKECPNCNEEIKGEYHTPGIVMIRSSRPNVPVICEYCGNDFPWKNQNAKMDANKSKEIEPVRRIKHLLSRFHLVVRKLKKRYGGREQLLMNDEYDVQYLLNSLLAIYFNDIRPEEWTPSYAGSSSRTDFLLKKEQLVIEVKMTRTTLKTKELGEQLIVDIERYKSHPDCKILICFVYDPDDFIDNPAGLGNDLSGKRDGLQVEVVIIPKGH